MAKQSSSSTPEVKTWKNDPENDKPVWIGLGVVFAFLMVLLAIGTTMRP